MLEAFGIDNVITSGFWPAHSGVITHIGSDPRFSRTRSSLAMSPSRSLSHGGRTSWYTAGAIFAGKI
jgi:hypothetical protein